MVLNLIALITLVLSCLGLIIIVLRKFPLLASIDVPSMTEDTAAKKSRLIEQRLQRKFMSGWSRVATVSKPLTSRLGEWTKAAHQKLVDLEHEYKVRALPVFLNRRQRQQVDSEIAEILAQARTFLADEEYQAAEEKALQAIRLEPRSVPAFELLGELYLAMNEHAQAKEVYLYLLKLVGESDAIYEHLGEAERGEGHLDDARNDLQKAIDLNANVMTYHLELAQVYRQLGDLAKAFSSIEAASHLEPNNPRVLDEYIEISIGYNKKQFAEDAVRKMMETNPDNSKIPQWRERIDAM